MTPTDPGIEVRRGARGTVYRARVRYGQREGGAGISRSFASREAALAWRAQALAAVRDGARMPDPPPRPPPPAAPRRDATVEDAAVALCRGMRGGTVRARNGVPYKPSVVRKYESNLRLHALPYIGGMPVGSLRKRDVQRFVDELAAEASAETARKALTALRVTLHFAERSGLVEGDPCSGVRVPTDPEGERPIRVITPEEGTVILGAAAADDTRLGERSLAFPLFALALGSGLRSGELLALPWGREGLDLDGGRACVRRSLDRVRDASGSFLFVPPKSRASRREVPLAPADIAILRRHRLASGRPPDGALVFSDAGRPLNATGLPRHAWRRVVEASGITEPLPRLHDARHAWAVIMLRAGARPEAVTKLGGWGDVGMVTRRYGRHALPDELADAGLALERFRTLRAEAAAQARPW